MEARTTKQGSSCHKTLSTLAKFHSVTDTTDKSAESFLQAIIPLSSENLKYYFFHLGLKIRNSNDIKKWTVVVHIAKRWGNDINKKVAMSVPKKNPGVIS